MLQRIRHRAFFACIAAAFLSVMLFALPAPAFAEEASAGGEAEGGELQAEAFCEPLRTIAVAAAAVDLNGDGKPEGGGMSNGVLYVAYGSNLNIAQMEQRCPGAKAVCTGKLEGCKLVFRKSKTGCYLSVDPCEGSSVDVAVWQLGEDQEKVLDRYEGYPKYYQKTVLPVSVDDVPGVQTLKGVVYYLPQERPIGPCSREYLDRVAAGYDHFGFDPDPLMDAYRYASDHSEVSG